MKLGSIHIHPLKAGRAVSLDTCDVEAPGLAGDRRWMLVDADGTALTQRDMPRLARLEATLDEDGLILVFDDVGERLVPTPDETERTIVHLWASTIDVALADPETNAALSDWLKAPVRLVHLDRPDARTANPDYAGPNAPVSLGDGYPILIATAASLRTLNREIVTTGDAEAVPMSRFRPNLVIEAGELQGGGSLAPWAEDGWKTLRIGDVVLDLVKPSNRCVVTTIDQLSGQSAGREPLDTLRRTRLSANRAIPGVLFGWNAVPCAGHLGRIAIGDAVEVLERRDESTEGAIVRPARKAAPPATRSAGDSVH